MPDELRGSTRAAELSKDRRGGARAGAGRKKGGKNLRKGWDAWVADIQAVTRREFRREKLAELAKADAWRYLERIAIPLALRSQPGTLSGVPGEDQLELPLVFVDLPALEDGDARGREAEQLGGGVILEGEGERVARD